MSAPEEEPAVEETGPVYEFDGAFQENIVALTLRDTVFAQRTEGLVKPEYFENVASRAVVQMALDFYAEYKKAPEKSSIPTIVRDAIASKRIRSDMIDPVKEVIGRIFKAPLSDRDLVIDKVAEFAKERAMTEAIMGSLAALEKKDYAKINSLVRAALDVGADQDDTEYDYFKEIDSRTADRIARLCGTIKPTGITTGYAEIDKHLYHGGWGRKELSAIMARAKWGKSMGLGDFGKNASVAGYNVLICSCEVSAIIYSDRLDANYTDSAMKTLKDRAHDVRLKILEKAAEAHGELKIHDFAIGTLKPSALRRLIERYRTRGIIFDLIIVDYADIMCPERFTDSNTENSKSIWMDLRAIGFEQNAAMLTATQTNRDGAKAATAKATDVAEDYNKVRIADLVISGNSTEEEMKSGEARLHFAASRNQEEVTLRIKQNRSHMRFCSKVLGTT
jgi:replicative DNA helicase